MVSSYYKDIYRLLCKRHPGKKIYTISDHHFYHENIIKYHRMEFEDVLKMNDYIIKKHNSVVGYDDIVIFLGDFSFKKGFIKELLSQMNGHKYLLLGNHDNENLIRCYADLGFEGIFTNPVKIKNQFLSHYPLCENEIDHMSQLLINEFNKSNGINYHGHLHGENVNDVRFVNVCCEMRNYEPLFIGSTKELEKVIDNPLFINSDYFERILEFLWEKKNINPSFVVSDYIYTNILEMITPYVNSSFVYGSFPLFKKYGYISNFSDLDIGLIYDETISKRKNLTILKMISDSTFEYCKNIDQLDILFRKRMENIRIFEFSYFNTKGHTYKGYYDANMIPLDIYRDTDFITFHGCSMLENFLKDKVHLLSHYKLPRYESNFLSVNGDIANIILQILFQQETVTKRTISIKKLLYLYKKHGNQELSNVEELEDIMTRFFIRNIMFLYTMKRNNEINYINNHSHDIDSLVNLLPITLKYQMEEILKNPNSLFNTVYKELSDICFEELPQKSRELIKQIKS